MQKLTSQLTIHTSNRPFLCLCAQLQAALSIAIWPSRIMRAAGGSLLSVADRIAQAALAVIAVCTGVWFRTAHLNYLWFIQKLCSYCSKNCIVLHSNNMNVAKCSSYMCIKPRGIENFFLSLLFFIKVDIKCFSNFPTDFSWSGRLKTCNEV